jgi:uncharacterized repeat protein (TIGR01451 family)
MNTISKKAVSNIIGTAILLGIAVVICSILYSIVLSHSIPQTSPKVTLVATVEGNNIIIEHRGGEDLSLNTQIAITIGSTTKIKVGDYLDEKAKQDGQWNVGERVIYPFSYSLTSKEAEMTVDDLETNTLVMLGTLDIAPEADIGVFCTVNNPSPVIGSNVIYTITATNYRGNMNITDILIKINMQEGLQYQNHETTAGTYNYLTGIWNITKLNIGESVTLNITVKVNAPGIGIPTQLAMLLDGSNSINDNDWTLMQTGLSKAVENSSVFPNDGSVELTVIQFGNPYPNKCIVHYSKIVTASNYLDIANDLNTLPQGKGGTPMAAGIYLTVDTLRNSLYFDTIKRQIILLVTDGKPTYYSYEGEYEGRGDGAVTHDIDLQTTENASDYLVNHLEMTGDQDQFDVFAIGTSPDIAWLNQSIVWPQPGHIAPPFISGRGWVRPVNNWKNFSTALDEVFKRIFNSLTTNAEIIYSPLNDPNIGNNEIEVIIIPHK